MFAQSYYIHLSSDTLYALSQYHIFETSQKSRENTDTNNFKLREITERTDKNQNFEAVAESTEAL